MPASDATLDARRVLAVTRALRPGRSWTAVANTIYMVILTLGMSAALFWGFWTYTASAIVDLARPYAVLWGPPAIALVLLATLRYNTLQGFASYTEADCLILLGSPVPRRDLVILRLRRIAVAVALAGAVIGALAALASRGLSLTGVESAQAVVAGAATGVIIVAAGWQVQRLPRLSLWVTRLTIPALAVVVVLALAGRWGGVAEFVALVSGPWGWPALPFAESHPAAAIAGPALLVVLAAVGWIGVRLTAGRVSIESFGLRAQVRSTAVASVWAMDTRSFLRAGRQASTRVRRARFTMRLPRRPVLAVCWHGLLLLLRSPLRFAWAVVLAGGGALVYGLHPGQTGTSWAGALLLYLAASALVEPIRMEMDSPSVARIMLPWEIGRVLQLHCLVPLASMLGAGLLGIAIGVAAGVIAGGAVPGVVVLVIASAAVQVTAAGLSAKRGGRLPQEMLLAGAGDTTGFSALTIVGWVFGWAILGVVASAVAATLALGRFGDNGAAYVPAGLLLLALAGILFVNLAVKKREGERKQGLF